MFYILQAIYGLDSLILSCNDNMILVNRFNDVMETSNIDDFTNFLNVFSEIRNKLLKTINEEELSVLFNEEKDSFRDYVLAGIDKQYTEVTKDKNGNFSKVDDLLSLISNDLGFNAAKKM